jgi:hypothetical protein
MLMVIFSLLSTSAMPSPSSHLETSLAPSCRMASVWREAARPDGRVVGA